jgi:hypothetical protein
MKAILAIAAVIAAGFLVLASGDKKVFLADRADNANRSLKERVLVKGNEKWYRLEDLQNSARQVIDQKTAHVQWGGLREVGVWIDSQNPTNLVVFHYSFGLGNRSFLVSFGKDGLVTQCHEGRAIDSVVPPAYKEIAPHP